MPLVPWPPHFMRPRHYIMCSIFAWHHIVSTLHAGNLYTWHNILDTTYWAPHKRHHIQRPQEHQYTTCMIGTPKYARMTFKLATRYSEIIYYRDQQISVPKMEDQLNGQMKKKVQYQMVSMSQRHGARKKSGNSFGLTTKSKGWPT